MSTSRWRYAGLLVALLMVVSGVPAAAAEPSLPDPGAAAPGGRLVVFWRGKAPATVSVAGVRAVRTGVDGRRSLVIAGAGREAAVIRALRRDARVAAVVPDAVVTRLDFPADPPDDLRFPEQEDLPQINVPEAWKRTTGDPSVVVAFIDSGYDIGHPDMAGVAVVAPRNETLNSTEINDVIGHGVHTSGTVFARPHNGIGIAGIAPDSTLMPIKILDGRGAGFFSDLLDGVDWARLHGADIISMSVGSWLTSDQAAAFQPVFTTARDAGILLVAAAGNSGNVSRLWPAALNGVLAVGAVDRNDVVASFSTRNSSVDIAAPGVDTLSLGINDPSGYERMSGTSMATPHVAGVAALVWAARPTLTVTELEAVLRASSRDLGTPGRDDEYGDGRVDALAALDEPVPNPIPGLDPPPPPPAEEFTLTFTAPAADVRQLGRSYTVGITTNHEPTDVFALRLGWLITGGACPPDSADWADWQEVTYAATVVQDDLKPGFCYRWRAAAIDANDEIVEAISPYVWIRDVTRPRVESRSPRAGLGGVSRRTRVEIRFSEPVTGVSASTFRLREVSTRAWVRARVSYDSREGRAVLTPAVRLRSGILYEVEVSSAIRDGSLNRLLPTRWVFRTGR